MSKRTPEELKQLRIDSLKKARAAKKQKEAADANVIVATTLPNPKRVLQMATTKSDVPHEFIGITRSDCCADCTAERCVISGRPVCAHPRKGGLQSAHMLDQAAVGRYNRALKHLDHVEVENRRQNA